MTQTQATDDGGSTTNTTRRGFVRLGIGATAATAAIGAGSSPAAAQSCDPEQSLSCSYGDQPDYGISYLVGSVKEHLFGVGSDSDYTDKQAETILTQAGYDFETIKSSSDSVLTTIENLEANAKSVAYQKARGKLLEELNAEKSVAESLTAAKQKIDQYISTNQKNLIERWNQVAIQVQMMFERANETDGVRPSDILQTDSSEGWKSSDWKVQQKGSQTLVDGSSVDLYEYRWTFDNGQYYVAFGDVYIGDFSGPFVSVIDGSPSHTDYLYPNRYGDIHSSLATAASDAKSNIQTFADNIQAEYESGEIDTEDLATPQDFFDMASGDDDAAYARADLAGLGFEVNQQSSIVIKLLNDNEQLEGSVYLSKSPIGESLTVGNVYDPTASRATDADGNPNDTIDDYEATESDPVPLDGLTFVAYNTDNGSTYDQIEQPFEVVNAFDENGEELQNVTYQPATGQQTTTTDIDELKKELQSMNDEIIELEEERRELATGGAGGFLEGTDQNVLIAGAAGIAAILLFGGGGSS